MGYAYKIRRVKQSRGYMSYTLSVPSEMAAQIPDNVKFEVEWNADGLLYRPVRNAASEEAAPEWTRE